MNLILHLSFQGRVDVTPERCKEVGISDHGCRGGEGGWVMIGERSSE